MMVARTETKRMLIAEGEHVGLVNSGKLVSERTTVSRGFV